MYGDQFGEIVCGYWDLSAGQGTEYRRVARNFCGF